MNVTNLRLFIFFFVATLFTTSCENLIGRDSSNSSNLSKNNLPVIKVDSRHDFTYKDNHAGENPIIIPKYEIAASSGLVLDVSDYDINKIPSQYRDLGITHPNRIFVGIKHNDDVYREDSYYREWLDNETSFVITTQNLIPNGGESPFIGFESGQHVTVSFGYWKNVFYPFWSAGIDIK